MNDESTSWLRYAEDNRQTAKLCLENGLLNPSIQNAQQSVEKALKALCLLGGVPVRKTHSIGGLRHDLLQSGVDCELDEEDCNLLDSVYLPSKYPLGSVLPDFDPDQTVAFRCLTIADKVLGVASERIHRVGQ